MSAPDHVRLALRDPARVLLALDLRDPFAYLALEPSFEWARVCGALLDPLPFAGHVLRPPAEAGDGDSRGVRHRRFRAEYLAREIASYAEAQDLVIRDPYRDAPADAAGSAWLWLRRQSPERLPGFLRALFRAYWALELDPADPSAVSALLGAVGADAGAWAGEPRAESEAALGALQQQLREAGVFQSPTYLLEGEHFCGRQHLPMLNWIVAGRVGPGPI